MHDDGLEKKIKNSKTTLIILRCILLILILIDLLLLLNIIITIYDNGKAQVERSAKPIIYLYPTEETEINVVLDKSAYLTCSYPKYVNGWKVLAKPNGDLLDLNTNKKLYALYYECENSNKYEIKDDGFVISGEDTAQFLEEKLAILGLSEREAEEFIIYWLPILENNKYNYIRFATADEINANIYLNISPKPDTLIRVLMTYKGLDLPITVTEQKLEPVERNGFVAVEWGGSEIK